MRYHPIDSALFVHNRKQFVRQLKSNSISVLNASDIMPTSADGTHRFVQNPDLFYLSGIDQEDTVLLIYPDAREEKFREVLFVRDTSEEIAVWEGNKLSRDDARKNSGIQTVYWAHEFEKIFRMLAFEADRIYLNTNEHGRADSLVETRDARFIKWCKDNFPLHKFERLAPVMQQLRATKSAIELDLIREACRITDQAFRRILPVVKPGVWEFEVEAEILHEFIRNRSRGAAFHPIVASGANSCVLHYVENNQLCRKGDVLLIDFGAEYANYAADVTRTIPVSGKFSQRQRRMYQAVLTIQKHAIQMLVPGNTFQSYHKEVAKVVESELIQLGLLRVQDKSDPKDEHPPYKKYFMHGISHHLGLDVHDLGDRHRAFEEGMVLTCEPGIYVREEGIGIRIENDILITAEGPVDLTAGIPIEADEIEHLMNS